LEATIDGVEARAYCVPTDAPESDGTAEWESTTVVVVELSGGGRKGLGYTYSTPSAAELIRGKLARIVSGVSALEVGRLGTEMSRAVRNMGRPGIASAAISAVDMAAWDLKARLLGLPLVELLGRARAEIPAYGSGGFTSYPLEKLYEQMHGWAAEGFSMMKMKIGRRPEKDTERVRTAREAIGDDAELFVDANGAYARKQALAFACEFAQWNVTWFEEPVTSDDLEGLRLLRDRTPAGMQIAAGEYGYDATYFLRMLEAGAVDVLQADATRCGISGFLEAAALCSAFKIPLSAHTAPSVHQHLCCAVESARHVEYFHDHVRIEQMFFDGAGRAHAGQLRPDMSRPGLGLELKRTDAEKYLVQPA
jgi:L-alanine-DL-glutamate epimerase-like enolase superfamily enzyme